MKFTSCLILFISLFFLPNNLLAQSDADWLFDDSSLPDIHILISQADLNRVLTNIFSDDEYPADFVFIRDGVADTVSNIGFRIRGNTSRSSDKKSFKVSFDTFVDGREYLGLDKMNINGEHNDPSIIRSKLSWDVFEAAGVIAPRSNHVRLYINDEYYGLYMNVEHIDNEFVKNRFGSDAGNLYKSLWPADLTYLGEDADDYKRESNGRRIYELKTNEDEDDYTDIANFIKFLTFATDEEFENEIRDYINVDGVIKVMAVDILTGMWDDYMFNKNNFYLYSHPETGIFEFIPYDYDNTFGIDWFGIDWATRDINAWGTFESRPLTDRLFDIQKYRDRLNFYIDQIIEDHFNTETLYPEIDRLKAMIQLAAEEDIYRTLDYGYTIDDFNDSYEIALGAHVKSGLRGYISNRSRTALIQTTGNNIVPIIHNVKTELQNTDNGPQLIVEAEIFDDDSPEIEAFFEGAISTSSTMLDNGLFGDAVSGDGIYTTTISLSNISGEVNIYVEAVDGLNQMERYPFNPVNSISIDITDSDENLVINEFMASNNSTIADEFGAYEDWVELYNPTSSTILMQGYYLTDDLANPTKWAFPDTVISPNGFLLIWVDDDEEEGPLHTTFKLARAGEDVGLYYDNQGNIETIDAFSYGTQTTDVSFGRQTDGSSIFVSFNDPTPGSSNGSSTSSEIESGLPEIIQLHQNYPNPFNPSTTISFQLDRTENIQLNLYSVSGSLIQTIASGPYNAGYHSFNFNASGLASGIYFYQLSTESGISLTQKMTLLK